MVIILPVLWECCLSQGTEPHSRPAKRESKWWKGYDQTKEGVYVYIEPTQHVRHYWPVGDRRWETWLCAVAAELSEGISCAPLLVVTQSRWLCCKRSEHRGHEGKYQEDLLGGHADFTFAIVSPLMSWLSIMYCEPPCTMNMYIQKKC